MYKSYNLPLIFYRNSLWLTLTVMVLNLFFQNLNAQINYEDAFPNISFNFPVEIQNANDGTNRLFVLEQPGIIKVFPNTSDVTENDVATFLDIGSKVAYNAGQEIGLLGLAFHPNFYDPSNRFFYVYYIDAPDNYRINVARYQVDETDPNYVDPNTETIILRFEKNQSNSNHNGGKIAFGPDGYLYISIGDGGGAGDPQGNGQNLDTAFGSILRIDVDIDGNNPLESNPELPNGNYEIPSDNPRVNLSGLDELYAWGIRNTWKFSFDGDLLYGADVGQDDFEEINIVENGGNYGWNRLEANSIEDASTSLVTTPDIQPIYFYDRANGDLSITGGYVYRGIIANNSIQEKYIYGDYVSGRVWALDYNTTDNTATSEFLFRTNGQYISSFGMDESGEIYFSDYGTSVKIYKITGSNTDSITTEVNGIGNWINAGVSGVNGVVETLLADNGDIIYAGGSFTETSGISANNLALYDKLNGWQPFGTGTNGPVYSIATDSNGNVYVGGDFSTINGLDVSNIAVWNGSTWSNMGSGTNGPVEVIGIDPNDNIYIGGAFEVAGDTNVNNIAEWNGANWVALIDTTNDISGTNNEVRSIAFDENNKLYIGGNFDSAGGNTAPRIATWDGTNWNTLGDGTSGFVQAILVTRDHIYIGGNFSIAGTETVNRIARWNRSNQSWEALDFGLSGSVNTLAHDGTYLYAGGSFETASDSENINKVMNNVARWSVIDGWEALGTNTDVGVDINVNSILFSSNKSELYVGGNFSTSGVLTANNIAIWGENVGCQQNSITPEYVVNGNVSSGSNNILISEGASFALRIQEDIYYHITLPDGSEIIGELNYDNVAKNQSGNYTITTTEGCTKIFELTVTSERSDDDNDGVANNNDLCKNTPEGEEVDQNGCSQSQLDDDNDQISNAHDLCPNSPTGETVDSNGCAQSQLDDDYDGVSNNLDFCPNSPLGTSVNENGCAQSQLDDDGDGVANSEDLCPNSPPESIVDSNGCAASELDSDSDGVTNDIDQCQNTPEGETVDVHGCHQNMQDGDNDGVSNDEDLCPGTMAGETVNLNGCSESQLDIDNDSVLNNIDLCPNTPSGLTVNPDGCALLELDSDDDNVNDAIDICPNTPQGEFVNTNGCSQSELDDDDDGIANSEDFCPNTILGIITDDRGCPFSLPIDNFVISTTSASCIGSDDGHISIQSEVQLDYTAKLTRTSFSETQNFSETILFDGLPAGAYELCITTSEIESYKLCSTIIIQSPEPLNVYSTVNNTERLVTLTMSGGDEYFVTFNDSSFKTSLSKITLNLEKETNTLKITTGKECQGIYEDTFLISEGLLFYPNPFSKAIFLSNESNHESHMSLFIYQVSGQIVWKKNITLKTNQEKEIPLTGLPSGVYFFKVTFQNKTQLFKMVKK